MASEKSELIKEIWTAASLEDFLAEMRPKQWLKNLLLFLPLIFAKHLFYFWDGLAVFAGFICFNFTASSIYLINDLFDSSRDRLHPVKKLRPYASGRLQKGEMIAASALLAVISVAFAFVINPYFAFILVLYYLTNLLYSESLKHKVLLDVLAIAFMFSLRVFAGAVLAQVEASFWLLICTFMLALFLGFAKRRHELAVLDGEERNHRAVLKQYSSYFLDQMIAVVTTSTVMSYILYTVSDETYRKFGTRALLYTTPFVLYGVFRYLFLIHRKKRGGDPASVVLSDGGMFVNLVLWGVSVVAILYFF
jgi:4-hydroxybenzoate polyprenyltransferase